MGGMFGAMKYKTRTMAILLLPIGDATYSEMATTVRINDKAAGEFVEVCQSERDGVGKIAIEPDEWPTLRAAINQMIDECRDTQDKNHE